MTETSALTTLNYLNYRAYYWELSHCVRKKIVFNWIVPNKGTASQHNIYHDISFWQYPLPQL